mgnify:CR=1 FL=1
MEGLSSTKWKPRHERRLKHTKAFPKEWLGDAIANISDLDISFISLSIPSDPMSMCAMTLWLRDFHATSFTQFGAFFGGEIISVLFGEKI